MSEKTPGSMRQQQAAATREKLLDSAQKLFAQNGYKGTAVRTINRSIDLADGLLYHYFPGGKKEIFQEVLNRCLRQVADELTDEEDIRRYLTMPLRDMLESIYVKFINTVEQHLDIIRIVAIENEVQQFVTKEQFFGQLANQRSWFPKLLEERHRNGTIRDMDFDMAGYTVGTVLMNHMIIKVFHIKDTCLENEDFRKRLIEHQVSLWENPSH